MTWKSSPFCWTPGGSACSPGSYPAEIKGSGEGGGPVRCSLRTMHAHIHIQYALTSSLSRGGPLQSERIAGCYCKREDLKHTTTWARFSHDIMQSASRKLLQPSRTPGMRILPA